MDYFDYCTGLTMTNAKFDSLFGGPPRKAEQLLTQREMDLTASVQKVLEDVLIQMTRSLAKEFDEENLCLAGGVALNCVANGKILRDGAFEAHLDSASVWRCRRRRGRGAKRLSRLCAQAEDSQPPLATAWRGPFSGQPMTRRTLRRG